MVYKPNVSLVESGIYANRPDAIRDAVRRLVLDKIIGITQNTGDSVKEIKKAREKLSKEKFDLGKMNKLADYYVV